MKTHSTAGTPMPTLLRRLFLFCNLLVVTGGSLVWAAAPASVQTRNGAGNNMGSVPVGIAYFDLDHLYDTIPALFYNDTDYTPEGALKWDSARYNRKIGQVAAILDSMRMPIVGLWSVENEAVVRDIAAACESGYTYLHETLNALDGMDFALLYYGDVFEPHHTETGRRYLYIEGVLRRTQLDTIGLLLCSDTRSAQWAVEELREERAGEKTGVKLVMLGRTASLSPAKYGLRDALARPTRLGRGNVAQRAIWRMRDRILVDTALHHSAGDVFARRWLVDPRTGYPVATYRRQTYSGGVSYALPVFTYIE